MAHLVAYDGRPPSEAALRRAADAVDREALFVVSVVPTDERLAETYGLAGDGEYDPDEAAATLRSGAEAVAPGCTFHARRIDGYAGKGRIAAEIRRAAGEVGADTVVVGSDNAGRVLEPLARVDDRAAAAGYDVLVVRPAP